MDYQAELKQLEENEKMSQGDFWKPEAGQHRIKALSEIEDSEPYVEEGKEPQARKKMAISIGNQKYIWTMPKGQTPSSTYGQLIRLATHKGKLTDVEFLVVVTGIGKSKRFTIV